MPRLYKPGESIALPLGLTSDSSATDLKNSLKEVLRIGLIAYVQRPNRGGLRLDNIVTDPLTRQSATILTLSGVEVSALHINSPQTQESPRIMTRVNFYNAPGAWDICQAQVSIADLDGGQKTERSYQLEDAQLGGVQAEAEWQQLQLGLELLSSHTLGK